MRDKHSSRKGVAERKNTREFVGENKKKKNEEEEEIYGGRDPGQKCFRDAKRLLGQLGGRLEHPKGHVFETGTKKSRSEGG